MDYIVHKIVNYPIDSNCFVIYKKYDFFCIVIDPGSENNEELISFFEKENIYPSYIILTHEHFDHILGANSLKEIYNSKIVCSEICSELISNSKKNLSLFYKNLDYKIKQVDILFKEQMEELELNNIKIKLYQTPGHSKASIAIEIGNHLFVGDTIINEKKTVTKLPGGDKEALIKSIDLINKLSINTIKYIHPGHG